MRLNEVMSVCILLKSTATTWLCQRPTCKIWPQKKSSPWHWPHCWCLDPTGRISAHWSLSAYFQSVVSDLNGFCFNPKALLKSTSRVSSPPTPWRICCVQGWMELYKTGSESQERWSCILYVKDLSRATDNKIENMLLGTSFSSKPKWILNGYCVIRLDLQETEKKTCDFLICYSLGLYPCLCVSCVPSPGHPLLSP